MPIPLPPGNPGNWWIHRTGGGGYEIVQGTPQQVDALYGASNVKGPYPTSDAANAAAGSVPIGGKGSSIETWLNQNLVSPVGKVGTALTSLNPLAPLFQANLWLRVGEFIIGLALIGVGLAKLTGTDNVISNAVKKMPVPI
jgi:hypothetical protein